jgi:hypothetical protein
MKILQHYHPQGSHLLRTIVEGARIFNERLENVEVTTLYGGNFLGAYTPLQGLSSSLSATLRGYRTIQLPHSLLSFELFNPLQYDSSGEYLSRLDANEIFLLHNSVRDSLYRGLSTLYSSLDLYVHIEGAYFQKAFQHRLRYASALFSYYRDLVLSYEPDLVTISHGNYDYYIALYLAARCNNTPVLLVHGGFNRSWLINNNRQVTDHSYSSEKIRICSALGKSDSSSDLLRKQLKDHISSCQAQNARIEAHGQSSFAILSKYYARSLENKGDISYVIMMPILGEVCHQDCFYDINFQSKPYWLDKTFQSLAKLPHKVVIRHHPEVTFYNEHKLSVKFLEYLSAKHNLPIKHIFSNADFSSFLEAVIDSSSSFVPLSFGSTISSELATAFLATITSNGCLASVIPDATVFQHKVDLLEPRPHLQDLSTRLLRRSTYLSDLQDLLRWTNLTGKYHSSDRVFRLRSDLHLFFGRQALIPCTELTYTLQDYMNSFDPSFLKVDDCLHIYS